MTSATTLAHPNIAFIKYWGNLDSTLRLPLNNSISMNLDGLFTRTQVTWAPSAPAASDSLLLNGTFVTGPPLQRLTAFLDIVRQASGMQLPAQVVTENNFPAAAGIASSASAFAALALAASHAAGLRLDEPALSRLARRGSGSACRSIPGGFVEWVAAPTDADSFATSLAPADHWALVDVIAILSTAEKTTGSTAGHALAGSSPLQAARVQDAPRRLDICRQAILTRDFDSFADIVEADSNLMHAIMLTSTPPLYYWLPATLAVMAAVRTARQDGLPACSTVDAGPNVHILCERSASAEVLKLVAQVPGVIEVRLANAGGPARLVE